MNTPKASVIGIDYDLFVEEALEEAFDAAIVGLLMHTGREPIAITCGRVICGWVDAQMPTPSETPKPRRYQFGSSFIPVELSEAVPDGKFRLLCWPSRSLLAMLFKPEDLVRRDGWTGGPTRTPEAL